MNLSDDIFENDSQTFWDDEKLKLKVKKCKEYVTTGQTIAYLDNIEQAIQLCLEYDLTEDGIFLTEAALEISPYSSDLWHSKGIFYNNLFDFENAYICLEKALSLNPSDVETMINKSIAEDNLGFWEESIKTLENALSLEPENEEVIFNLGIFYERKDYFEKAIEYFKQTIKIDEEYSDVWYEIGYCYENINQPLLALDAYRKFLDFEPYSASGWYNCGIVYLKLDNYTEAINCFELAISINDDFVNSWYNLGIAYSNLNMFAKAKESFLKAFNLDPFDETIPLNLAQTCEAIGDYDSALTYYNAAINTNKTEIEAHIGRGNCFAKNNNFAAALQSFSTVIKLTNYQNYSSLSKSEANKKIEENFKIVSTFSKTKEYSEAELFNISVAFTFLGNWNKAIDVYKELIVKTEKASAFYEIAINLFMLNKNEDALKYLLESFELNPNLEINFLDDYPALESTYLYIKITDAF